MFAKTVLFSHYFCFRSQFTLTHRPSMIGRYSNSLLACCVFFKPFQISTEFTGLLSPFSLSGTYCRTTCVDDEGCMACLFISQHTLQVTPFCHATFHKYHFCQLGPKVAPQLFASGPWAILLESQKSLCVIWTCFVSRVVVFRGDTNAVGRKCPTPRAY